jgi:hypothetical protein
VSDDRIPHHRAQLYRALTHRPRRPARIVPLCAVSFVLGCSGRVATTGSPDDVGAADVTIPADAAGEADDAEDVAPSEASPNATGEDGAAPAPALQWAAVSANIVEGDITSVWGTSSADVYVGTDMKSVYLLTSGASTWTGLPPGVIGAGWGSDAQSVYAVGASAWLQSMGVVSSGGVFRYSGDMAWTSVATGVFYAVWGSSAKDVYAGGEPGILHSTGGGPFASEAVDGDAGDAASGNVLSVWGSGATDVYAGTSIGTIVHSGGDGNWQTAYAEATGQVWAGWSSGPGDAYAVVATGGPMNPPAHLVHSMSSAGGWATESVSPTPTTLVTLWGSSATDVYAGGWHVGSAGKAGDLFHSTGNGQWTAVALPGKPYDVRCIWGSSATDVYVGIYDAEDGPVLLHGQP